VGGLPVFNLIEIEINGRKKCDGTITSEKESRGTNVMQAEVPVRVRERGREKEGEREREKAIERERERDKIITRATKIGLKRRGLAARIEW
jgi:hypothetical protein